MGGAVLMGPGMAGFLVSPQIPQTDNAVAWNYERFDGLGAPPAPNGPVEGPEDWDPGLPLDAPAASSPENGGTGFGADFYPTWQPTPPGQVDQTDYPRPGQLNQPRGQVYTQGPLQGVVGTLGGQPLPRAPWLYRAPGDYTHAKWPTIQWRLGVGQYGPSSLGIANTVALSEITNNPPVPGDISGIIAGLG